MMNKQSQGQEDYNNGLSIPTPCTYSIKQHKGEKNTNFMHFFSVVILFDHLVLCDDTSVNEMLLIVQPF